MLAPFHNFIDVYFNAPEIIRSKVCHLISNFSLSFSKGTQNNSATPWYLRYNNSLFLTEQDLNLLPSWSSTQDY